LLLILIKMRKEVNNVTDMKTNAMIAMITKRPEIYIF
jgi:hypothetical protein